MSQREYVRTLVYAAALGVPAALAGALFQSALHHATEAVWHDVPDGFGWPLPAALLLFEGLAAAGRVPAAQIGRTLLPGLVAAGSGALVYTGVRDWPGVDQVSLALPGVPPYPTVRIADVAWCIPVALAVGLVVVVLKRLALGVAGRASRRPDATLIVAGLLVGALAVAFRAAADRPVDFVLLSGLASLPAVVAETSAGVLVLLVVAKGLAYALSLGAGFRGGPVFPALVLGAEIGALAALALPGWSSRRRWPPGSPPRPPSSWECRSLRW